MSLTSTTDDSRFFPLGFIRELSKHIGGDWKELARQLGLLKTDIDAVECDNRGLKEQIYQFFYKRKQHEGKNATVKKLIDGLKDAGLNEQLALMQKAGFLPEGKMSQT